MTKKRNTHKLGVVDKARRRKVVGDIANEFLREFSAGADYHQVLGIALQPKDFLLTAVRRVQALTEQHIEADFGSALAELAVVIHPLPTKAHVTLSPRAVETLAQIQAKASGTEGMSPPELARAFLHICANFSVPEVSAESVPAEQFLSPGFPELLLTDVMGTTSLNVIAPVVNSMVPGWFCTSAKDRNHWPQAECFFVSFASVVMAWHAEHSSAETDTFPTIGTPIH